jgi:hypothetical protein
LYVNKCDDLSIDQGKLCKISPWSSDFVDDITKYAHNRKVWANLLDEFPHPYSTNDANFWVEFNSQPDQAGKNIHSSFPTSLGKNFAICVKENDKFIPAGGIGVKTNDSTNTQHIVEIGYFQIFAFHNAD